MYRLVLGLMKTDENDELILDENGRPFQSEYVITETEQYDEAESVYKYIINIFN